MSCLVNVNYNYGQKWPPEGVSVHTIKQFPVLFWISYLWHGIACPLEELSLRQYTICKNHTTVHGLLIQTLLGTVQTNLQRPIEKVNFIYATSISISLLIFWLLMAARPMFAIHIINKFTAFNFLCLQNWKMKCRALPSLFLSDCSARVAAAAAVTNFCSGSCCLATEEERKREGGKMSAGRVWIACCAFHWFIQYIPQVFIRLQDMSCRIHICFIIQKDSFLLLL